jgi:hypothetical protein
MIKNSNLYNPPEHHTKSIDQDVSLHDRVARKEHKYFNTNQPMPFYKGAWKAHCRIFFQSFNTSNILPNAYEEVRCMMSCKIPSVNPIFPMREKLHSGEAIEPTTSG